jgi:hypothetical protein
VNRRTLKTRPPAGYTEKLQGPQAKTSRALCHTPPPGARSAGWGGSVLGPTTASCSACLLGTSWRPTQTRPTPQPSDSTRGSWVGPWIPTTGVTTIPNSTIVSCSSSPCRDCRRSRPGATIETTATRPGATTLSSVAPRSQDRLRRSPSGFASCLGWRRPIGSGVQIQPDRRSVSQATRAVIRQQSDMPIVVPQPDGRLAHPRSGLRHPVLAMVDRSIDPMLGLTHACPSVRRRLA